MDDLQLLKQYVKDGSQDAFAAIVRRHVDLVYGTARRLVGDEQLAEDVAQAAFLVLAQKAKQVEPGRLAGWLVNATRLAAHEARRGKLTREKHEWRAAQMRSSKGGEDADEPTLAELSPLLDEALCRLREADRTAVAMRFLQGRSFAEVAAAMGSSEEAARKRVERAVEKLRGVFMKKGLAPSVGGLMVVLAAHQAQAAPAGLAGSISATAISGGTGTSAILAKGAMTMMMMAKVKVAAVVVLVIAAAVGVGIAAQPTTAPVSAASAAQPATDPAATQALIQQLEPLLAGFEQNIARIQTLSAQGTLINEDDRFEEARDKDGKSYRTQTAQVALWRDGKKLRVDTSFDRTFVTRLQSDGTLEDGGKLQIAYNYAFPRPVPEDQARQITLDKGTTQSTTRYLWVENLETVYEVENGNLYLRKTDNPAWPLATGLSWLFNAPDVLQRSPRALIAEAMRRGMIVKLNDEGDGKYAIITSITGKTPDQRTHEQSTRIVLDSRRGYTIQSVETMGDGKISTITQYDYANLGGAWVVVRGDNRQMAFPSDRIASRVTLVVESKSLKVNQPVDSAVLNVDHLQIKKGTMVSDSINKRQYRFGK